MRELTATAHARAGLLGNPGDGYGGKALAIALRDFSARVTLRSADRFAIARGVDDRLEHTNLQVAVRSLHAQGCYDGIRLMRAAVARFAHHWPELSELASDDPRLRFEMSYATDVPRQVGLSGSSAIVIAALRALDRWFERDIPAFELAELALAAEVQELGITAGPMDRVIQSYEGVMHMDFSGVRTPDSYRRLDPLLLPPLFIAWDPGGGEMSGVVHRDVRRAWEQGDPLVRRAMARFPELVDEGMRCLEAGDAAGFARCVDENFDTRASIWTLAPRDLEMIAIGRASGAAVKFCGSGGAVVGVLRDEASWEPMEARYRAAGYGTVRPTIATPAESRA